MKNYRDKLRILGAIAVLVFGGMLISGIHSDAGASETAKKPWLTPETKNDPAEHGIVCEELSWGAKVEIEENMDNPIKHEDIPEYEQDPDRMVWEVVNLWEMFFDDDDAPAGDPRRDRFEEFAGYLVDAVLMYQNEPTDLGGQLPKHRNVHLLIAERVTRESSVTHNVVGPGGEVGLLQLMPGGPAMAGYSPEKVKNNPKLGLLLGTRWLAAQIPECKDDGNLYEFGWDDWDWLGPLSVYMGGDKAKRKNGTCAGFKAAKTSIRKTILYRTRIDHDADYGY